MNLALVANNIGVMWVAIELATLTTVLMVGIYRTHEALEAAWKYFILGIGRHRARAVRHHPGLHGGAAGDRRRPRRHGLDHAGRSTPPTSTRRCSTSRSCSCCSATAPRSGLRRCTPGCRTPMPKARRRSRRCCRGCCSTSRSMRCCASRCCWRPIPAALAPGPLMVTMGLISLVFAAFMLYRRRDIKRLFAYSSIEHMGIITFAFGMGGPLANFAGLLHMTMHSLTKSAIFFAVGHIAQVKGTQQHRRHRRPDRDPSGARLGPGARRRRHRRPAAARHLHERVPAGDARPSRASRCSRSSLVFGLLVGVRRAVPAAATPSRSASRAARPAQVEGVLRADVRASRARVRRRRLPAAGAGAPGSRTSRELLGIDAMADTRIDTDRGRTAVDGHRPWPRVVVDAEAGVARSRTARCRRRWTLLGLWGDDRRGAHGAARRARDARSPSSASTARTDAFPRSARCIRRPSGSSARSAISSASSRSASPDTRPWLDHGRWGVRASARRRARRAGDARRPMPSCRSRARACTRFRSARCMPASSSPAISASPPTARRWCGWRSGSAMSTRASTG